MTSKTKKHKIGHMKKENEELKKELYDAGISREDVARHVGCSVSTVHNWLSAGRPIPPAKLRAIRELLNTGKAEPIQLDKPICFEVRLTPKEYRHLCQLAGWDKLDAEEASRQMTRLLQESWEMMTARDSGVLEAAEPEE